MANFLEISTVSLIMLTIVRAVKVSFYEMCAGNEKGWVHYLAKAEKGLVCYTFVKVDLAEFAKFDMSSAYNFRRSICLNMCPVHESVTIHDQKDVTNIAAAIKYFESVSSKDTVPRYYDVGYRYRARLWVDYSPVTYKQYVESFEKSASKSAECFHFDPSKCKR
ncbi:unnamed protein product [Toxocara canis]|uniref:Lipocalin n=1 Tax=Toxocara canis TaxID=6265 RepID=A0A183V9F8_TOXCA|nr:unnamed protein product [Toxocara canis]